MGTRSPFKPTRLRRLFWVTIDFMTKAMTSLISPLVRHLTQMGSLAAGPDNILSGYGTVIGWIKHTAHFASSVIHATLRMYTLHFVKLEKVVEVLHLTAFKTKSPEETNSGFAFTLARTNRNTHYQQIPLPSFNLNLICERWETNQQIAFQQVFQNKNNNEGRIIFTLIRGHQLS